MKSILSCLILAAIAAAPALGQSQSAPDPSLHSETASDHPANLFVITGDEIQAQGWQSLEEVLSHVPGMVRIDDYLWFGTDNFASRGFFTAGFFNNYNVMVDGVSQMEDWYNSFPLNHINVPVEAVDRVEVITGVVPAEMGNNAFLGTIHIITRKDEEQSIATAGLGTAGQYRAATSLSRQTGDLALNVTAGIRGTDGISEAWNAMTSTPFAPGIGAPSTTEGQLADRRGYIGASLAYRNLSFQSSQNFSRRGVVDYYPGIGNGHSADVTSSSQVLGYRSALGQARISLQAGYHSFRNRLDYRHLADSLSYAYNDIYSDAVSAAARIDFSSGGRLRTSIGASYRHVFRDKLVVDAPYLSAGYVNLDAGLGRGDAKSNWTAFIQSIYSFNERLDLMGAVRLQQTPQYDIHYQVGYDPNGNYTVESRVGTYEYDKIEVLPQVALVYRASETHQLKALFGTAVKEPSIGENMDIVRYPTRPQLEPARIRTAEFVYSGSFEGRFRLDATLFHNQVDKLISRTNAMLDGQLQLFNTNSGKLRTTGTAITLHYLGDDRLTARAGLVYQTSKNLQDGYEDIDLEYAPVLSGVGVATLRFAGPHTIAASVQYVGEMDTYWAPASGSTDPADGGRIGAKSPSYVLTGANLRFNDLLDRGFFAHLYVSNVFDTQVIYPTTRSNDAFDLGTRGFGRVVSVGVGLEW